MQYTAQYYLQQKGKVSRVLLGQVLMAASLLSDHSDSTIRVCFESFLTLHTNDKMSTQTQPPSYEMHRQRTPTHSAPRVCALHKISPAPRCQFELLPLGFCLCHTEWTTNRHRASFLPPAIQLLNKTTKKTASNIETALPANK